MGIEGGRLEACVLHVDDLTGAVGCYWGGSPYVAGGVVVGADARVVAAWTAASDEGAVEVGECGYWF